MREKLKKIGKWIGAIVLLGSVVYVTYLSAQESLKLTAPAVITSDENISDDLEREQYDAVKLSRTSAVRVMSLDSDGDIVASSSGTYITHDYRSFFVLTADHGIVGDCEHTKVVVGGSSTMYDCLNYLRRSRSVDYMIMQVEEIPGRQPVVIPGEVPRNNEWAQPLSIMKGVYYTGYPNSEGPVTIGGHVMGYDAQVEMIMVNSFAWPGSSGAGVFSEDGELIGIVIALDVGRTPLGFEILENFVWVLPVFRTDWEVILEQ